LPTATVVLVFEPAVVVVDTAAVEVVDSLAVVAEPTVVVVVLEPPHPTAATTSETPSMTANRANARKLRPRAPTINRPSR